MTSVQEAIPTVSRVTADSMIADLLREEEETQDGSGLVIDWIRDVAISNPEIVRAITWFASMYEDEEIRSAYLAAMAITYRAISAAAEVQALEAIGGEPVIEMVRRQR